MQGNMHELPTSFFYFKKEKEMETFTAKLRSPALQWHPMVADQNTAQRQDIGSV